MRSWTTLVMGLVCGCGDAVATSAASTGSTGPTTGPTTGGADPTDTTTTTGTPTATGGSGDDSVTASTEALTASATTEVATTDAMTAGTTTAGTTTAGTTTTGTTTTGTTGDTTEAGGTGDASTGDPLTCSAPVESPGDVAHFGGLGGEQALGFAVDDDGARYSGGIFFGASVDLKPGGGAVFPAEGKGGNMWLNKIAADGTYQYGYTWPTLDGNHCYVRAFAPDLDGSVFVAGHFVGDLDLDPGPGVDKHVAGNGAGNLAAFLIKLGPDGAYQWGRSWSGGAWMTAFGLAMAADGSLHIIGHFNGSADLDPGPGTVMATASGIGNATDAYLSKFDHDGELLWARTWGAGGQLYGFQVAVDEVGNVYVSGTTGGPADLDPGPGAQIHEAQGLNDAYVARFLADGTWKWAFAVGGDNIDQFNAISVDPSGRAWLAGGFSSTQLDVDPGPGATTLVRKGQSYDGMLVRYTPDGALDLALHLGGDEHDNLWGLATDCDGDTYLAGHVSGTADLDPGPGVAMHVSAGSTDAFLLALDDTGAYRWSKVWPGPGSSGTKGVSVDGARMVHAQITFDQSIDGDAGPGTQTFDSKGAGDVLLQRLRPASGDW